MSADTDKLLNLLSVNRPEGKGCLTVPVLVEPFLQYAEEGMYWLGPVGDLEQRGAVAHCISRATKKPVNRVKFVSVDSLIKEVGDTTFIDSKELMSGIGMSIGTTLMSVHAPAVWKGLATLEGSVADRITEILEEILWSKLKKTVMPGLDPGMWYSLRSGLGACLQYYLGSLILGDMERVAPLGLLLTVYAKYIPVGSPIGEPRTCIVLAA